MSLASSFISWQTEYHLSDASITLPGGFGSMEELFEKLSWKKLGLHHQPIGLLNIIIFANHY
jgi:predicted Rossmann-fold nucleotide-binding protein